MEGSMICAKQLKFWIKKKYQFGHWKLLITAYPSCSVNITKNLPMQYTEIFSEEKKNENFIGKKKDIFLIFAQNIDCGTRQNRLAEAVLTSTHNLCFGAKMRKIGIPLHTPVFLYKCGV